MFTAIENVSEKWNGMPSTPVRMGTGAGLIEINGNFPRVSPRVLNNLIKTIISDRFGRKILALH